MTALQQNAVRHATGAPASSIPRIGRGLYVGGSDMFNKMNQPAQNLPLHWAPYVDQLDIVGYRAFYDGPPAPAPQRLLQGLKGIATRRVSLTQDGNLRRISVRQMRLPNLIDVLVQDFWILLNLRGQLASYYDVGIVYAPESAFVARYLKRTGRVGYLVYHDIDYYPYVPFVRPRQRPIVAWREKMAVRAADAVISVSRPLMDLRRKQGAQHILYLPNGVDFSRFDQANALRDDHPPTMIYVGTLDEKWGVDLPIRAMPLILERIPEARLVIAGKGRDEEKLQSLARELALGDAVEFLGFVPYQDLPEVMARADIGLATSREDIFRQYASPLKLVEYMAAGLPVICSGGGEAELMITESGGGINVELTPESCADAACRMLTDTADLAERRQAAIDYARSRTWQQLAEKLAHFLAQRENEESNREHTS